MTAYNLTADSLNASPVNQTMNLPDSNSDYYTWEITATKRQRAGWSLLASFTETWSHEAALGTGNDFTPNALINATGNQDRFRTWQAKLNGTISLRWGFLARPRRPTSVRHTVRAHLRPNAQLRQRDHQGGTDCGQSDACHHARRLAHRENVSHQSCACHWILRRVQHVQHQCCTDDHNHLGWLVAAADRNHGTARPPDRCPVAVVAIRA